MAHSHEKTFVCKGLMVYMTEFVKHKASLHDKRIARSSEFKSFLLYLSEKAPSAMSKVLKSASGKCENANRVGKGPRSRKKRAASPKSTENSAKRLKITHPSQKQTAPSRQTVGLNSAGQVRGE